MKQGLRPFISEQFSAFESDLSSNWGVAASTFKTHEAKLKHVFRRFISISCAATVLSENTPRSSYLMTVPESAYLAMTLSMRGAANTCLVLGRQTIELVLKHIYYSTHPVEFGWAQRRAGYREQGFQNLLDYVRNTEELALLPTKDDVVGSLADWYSMLSGHVHVHNAAYFGFPKIPPMQSAQIELQELIKVADAVWPTLVLLLRIFFPQQYDSASQREKMLMKDCLPAKLRMQWASWEYKYSKTTLDHRY